MALAAKTAIFKTVGVSRCALEPTNPRTKTLAPNGPIGGVAQGSGQLKEVRGRIKSIQSVEKITKTMKMIASSRLRSSQNRMFNNRAFYEGCAAITNEIPVKKGQNSLIVSTFADRGLCGGINSFVNKYTNHLVDEKKKTPNSDVKIIFIGNKGASLLAREQGERIQFGARDISKPLINFEGVSVLVEQVMKIPDLDTATVVFNHFENAASFKTMQADLNAPKAMKELPEYSQFEFEDDQQIFHQDDLFEFQLANTLYHAVCEGNASELAARMTAMDNATRNAGDILRRLNIFYNRGRQAAITTELSEIIGGKTALENQ